MKEQYGNINVEVENKRKYLFLRQVEMLDGFLKNGAINRAQYDFSYSGLVTKMNVTQAELDEWLLELEDKKQGEDK